MNSMYATLATKWHLAEYRACVSNSKPLISTHAQTAFVSGLIVIDSFNVNNISSIRILKYIHSLRNAKFLETCNKIGTKILRYFIVSYIKIYFIAICQKSLGIWGKHYQMIWTKISKFNQKGIYFMMKWKNKLNLLLSLSKNIS